MNSKFVGTNEKNHDIFYKDPHFLNPQSAYWVQFAEGITGILLM